MVLEYLDGRDLSGVLPKEGPCSSSRRLPGVRTREGVAAAHDLKSCTAISPSNVFLADERRAGTGGQGARLRKLPLAIRSLRICGSPPMTTSPVLAGIHVA